MRKFAIVLVLVIAGALWAQDGVETNASYNLWAIRGPNGVCATVMDDNGRWRIRTSPGYTLEPLHDDKRPSVAASPFEAPAAPALAFPADVVKKGK